MQKKFNLLGEVDIVGAATVEVLTTEDAARRRAEILAALGGDEQSLRLRAAQYALDADELAALDELDALDYLLGAGRRA